MVYIDWSDWLRIEFTFVKCMLSYCSAFDLVKCDQSWTLPLERILKFDTTYVHIELKSSLLQSNQFEMDAIILSSVPNKMADEKLFS